VQVARFFLPIINAGFDAWFDDNKKAKLIFQFGFLTCNCRD